MKVVSVFIPTAETLPGFCPCGEPAMVEFCGTDLREYQWLCNTPQEVEALQKWAGESYDVEVRDHES